MRSIKDFQNQLRKISGIPIEEPYYRYLGIQYLNDPLAALQSKLNGGRYNYRGAFEALYMAPDPITAVKEGSKNFDFKFPPKAIITIEVEVRDIIDLENQETIKTLGITKSNLLKPWRESQDIFEDEAYTQVIGRLIYESNKFEGIRYPSAKVDGKYNLMIFPDRLKNISQTSVYDPDKILEKIKLLG